STPAAVPTTSRKAWSRFWKSARRSSRTRCRATCPTISRGGTSGSISDCSSGKLSLAFRLRPKRRVPNSFFVLTLFKHERTKGIVVALWAVRLLEGGPAVTAFYARHRSHERPTADFTALATQYIDLFVVVPFALIACLSAEVAFQRAAIEIRRDQA